MASPEFLTILSSVAKVHVLRFTKWVLLDWREVKRQFGPRATLPPIAE